ncbi:MAG: hypothetical protein M3326_14000, partial [Actinomycetota bacterium]|nr:hypothetical protein [Actinomycetota bacterium]
MAAPPRRRIGAVAMALFALWAGLAPAAGAQIEDKRAEAAAIASKLEDQARAIVALDREHRRARDELAVADAAVARAEADLAAAWLVRFLRTELERLRSDSGSQLA